MKKTIRTAGMSAVALGVAFSSMTGHAQQDPQDAPQDGVATKAAEKLDEVGRAIKKGFLRAEETVREELNKTGETVREGFAKTRETVQSMGIPSRVYGRLHWDKEFHSISLFVKAEGGRVTVRGILPDDASKARAIALVKDTVGVTHVIDQISVLSSTASTIRPATKR
jgi:hyperosmotically inducible periplasmic protein